MKTCWFIILSFGLASIQGTAADNILASQKDKISYAIGMQIARSITNSQIEVVPDALAAGLKSIFSGTAPLLTEAEYREAITTLQTQLQAKQAERMKQNQARKDEQMKLMEARNKELGEKAKKEGEEFLAANKKKEGVITTPSGLQYKILVKGNGPKPTGTDTVIVHYRGSLVDGVTEFDSSYKRGEPAEFKVSNLIKGWTEALQMMPVGSKWQLFIPADLAYGEAGRPPSIPRNSVLLFDMELIGIKSPDAKTETPKAK